MSTKQRGRIEPNVEQIAGEIGTDDDKEIEP
jgi:hypothetical protein